MEQSSPPDSPIEIFHRESFSRETFSRLASEDVDEFFGKDQEDDIQYNNSPNHTKLSLRNILKKKKATGSSSNLINGSSSNLLNPNINSENDSPYKKMLSRQNTEKRILEDDVIDSVTNELNDFIKYSFSRTNTEKSLANFMASPGQSTIGTSPSDGKKRARSMADFSSLVSFLQPSPNTVKEEDEEKEDEDDININNSDKKINKENANILKTNSEDSINQYFKDISPIKNLNNNNTIDINYDKDSNSENSSEKAPFIRSFSTNVEDDIKNEEKIIRKSQEFQISNNFLSENNIDNEDEFIDYDDKLRREEEKLKKKVLEDLERQIKEEKDKDFYDLLQSKQDNFYDIEMEKLLNEDDDLEGNRREEAGVDENDEELKGEKYEDSLDYYKKHLEEEVDNLLKKNPNYFKPTISSILHPYINNELDMVKNSFFVNSYSTLKKLPDYLHPGEFERKKKKLIVENLLKNSSSNFKPASSAFASSGLYNRIKNKDSDKKLMNNIEKLLPELNNLNNNYLTILTNEKKKNIISHHHYLPNNNIDQNEKQNEFTNDIKHDKVDSNFRFDPYIRKPFVVNARGRSAGDDVYLTTLPQLTTENDKKKKNNDSINSHSLKKEEKTPIFYSVCTRDRGVNSTTRKLFTKNSKLELKKIMKKLYDMLSTDWKAYPFRLKYTKSHELLIQFITPDDYDHQNHQAEDSMKRYEEDKNNDSQNEGLSATGTNQPKSLPFPPPNNSLVKYMRHLSRHGIVKDFGFHRRGDRWYVLEEEIEEENFDFLNENETDNLDNLTDIQQEHDNSAVSNVQNTSPIPPVPSLSLSSKVNRPSILPDIIPRDTDNDNNFNEPLQNENIDLKDQKDVENAVNNTISLMFGSNLIIKDKDILRSSLTTSSFIQNHNNNHYIQHNNKLSPHRESNHTSFLSHDYEGPYDGNTLTAKPAKIITYLTFSFYAPWIHSNQFNTTKEIAKLQREKAREYRERKKEENNRLYNTNLSYY